MRIKWKKIEETDREQIESYFRREQSRNCEFTFGNNILWSQFYLTKFAIVEDMLIFYSEEEPQSVSFPLGKTNIKQAVETLLQHFEEEKILFQMHLVTKEQFETLDAIFPGKFQIEFERDMADYVYESEKLISLAGSKLHGKRNHINKFIEQYPDWTYETITEKNRQECLDMAKKWWIENREDNQLKEAIDVLQAVEDDVSYEDFEKRAELEVTKNALLRMEELNLRGGLIRADGKVVAFSIGEPTFGDTFIVHIEKAYADVQGAYPIINREFVKHEASEFTYINREEDTGAEGLRKAKLSYRPAFLLEKGTVTLKN